MSEKESALSTEVSDQQEKGIVLDFLYYDSERVASFLSQMVEHGHLQRIIQTTTVGKEIQRGHKTSLGGGLPGVGSLNFGFERGPGKGRADASEREYNPFWANALALLDYLTQRDLIRRDLNQAGLGEVVEAEGALAVLNTTMLRGAWDGKAIKKLITVGAGSYNKGTRNQRRGQASQSLPHQDSGMTEVLVEVIKLLPHMAQGRLAASDSVLWFSLQDEYLVPSVSDIVLKHGVAVAGSWRVLGILDARPGDASSEAERTLAAVGLGSDQSADPGSSLEVELLVANVTKGLSNVARGLLGRPDFCFGVTPLLIFRVVAS